MKYASLQDRIIANTVLSTENSYDGTPCWEWIGKRSARGTYGHINLILGGKHVTLKAHRVSLHAFTGFDLASLLVVQHLCNNGLCCAPLHLRAGTQSENIKQCIAEGRHNNFGRGEYVSPGLIILEEFPL